ncbi:Ni-sirohydrochlorin a,c-diamide synthase [Methanohalophilus euhalobius]|uniref:Cobyrinate a,c-diamide synthase n=1 Tax=Methanohalophilus euhalobius TaxID=51203 RepID=A0A315A262_9EURY|nr:Ni-sirohydrochlorin a,c-diamide synthase [Methanohalophilus euhalobius]PQV43684.1 hydrogenobyrinic acid a,c-diamide synthase (glutamine-hydrolysing) /cobyrinate a,c-diamide synthase [Methanohalophilus euhalobius]RNI12680.1 Ni-sirohydrochlorin a,c-diamide synthase [Methanohalophilus euhalobius]
MSDQNLMEMPRLLISADRSSSGKTTIVAGMLAALTARGYRVQPFKVGLDYIDPSYHSEITGRNARNIDGYLMDEEGIRDVFTHGCETDKKADVAIIEGVRGLYEGFDSFTDTGSTAQIAKILKCPVVLVINARSITRSAAALVKGYTSFDENINIAGVILNNIGNPRHAKKASEAIEHYTGIPVLGTIRRDNAMQISMRHLGLIPALEGRRRISDLDQRIGTIRDRVDEGVDIAEILKIANSADPVEKPPRSMFTSRDINGRRPKIGVALDEAFNFYYYDNIELLQLAGADLEYFSPVHDGKLPDVDGLYIGGGYPELFASQLQDNESLRREIREASRSGMPIYAECGGLMYLTEKLTTGVKGKGTYHMAEMPEATTEMVGALPGHTLMGHTRVVSYNNGQIVKDAIIGRKGNTFRGHEFHHSEIRDIPDSTDFAIKLSRGIGIKGEWDGMTVENTLGSYAHLEGVSYREFARSFVDSILK